MKVFLGSEPLWDWFEGEVNCCVPACPLLEPRMDECIATTQFVWGVRGLEAEVCFLERRSFLKAWINEKLMEPGARVR